MYLLPPHFDGCYDEDTRGELYTHHRGGFILLEEGNCTYEEKARRVERMGAQGLIIATDLLSDIESRTFHYSDS